MPDYTTRFTQTNFNPRDRARRLSMAYKLILSWKHPQEKTAEPVDLGGETGTAAKSTPAEKQGAK